MSDKIELTINGRRQSFKEQISISELLESLDLVEKGVFIEYNKEPLQRELYGQTRIHSGDNIEIVTMMAGG